MLFQEQQAYILLRENPINPLNVSVMILLQWLILIMYIVHIFAEENSRDVCKTFESMFFKHHSKKAADSLLCIHT